MHGVTMKFIDTVYPHIVHGTHASQGKSYFISLLSKMFLIVRNFLVTYSIYIVLLQS